MHHAAKQLRRKLELRVCKPLGVGATLNRDFKMEIAVKCKISTWSDLAPTRPSGYKVLSIPDAFAVCVIRDPGGI